jgi:hypothetical protein
LGKYLFFILFLVSAISFSCRRTNKLPDKVEAYYVQYDITYLNRMAGDIPTRILPARMDSWYTNYFVLTRIDGFFKQFSLMQIADLRTRQVFTLLNFFGNKFYCLAEKGELPAGIIAPDKMSYRATGKTSIIGGLLSEQVEVDNGDEKFNIYFTRDFSVRRPNLSTPYGSINHPLSDFRVELSYLDMHLKCESYETRIIDSEIFMIPEEYVEVSRPKMEEIINSLFTKE